MVVTYISAPKAGMLGNAGAEVIESIRNTGQPLASVTSTTYNPTHRLMAIAVV